MTDALAYNDFGEPISYVASFSGSAIYGVQYTRDALGRIAQKIETIDGTTDTISYGYDLAGRLADVKKNGTTIAAYAYGNNGNRVSGPIGTKTYNYDEQDRLTGSSVLSPAIATLYSYTANGELLTKTADGQITVYQYDELGNLVEVNLPSGKAIDYVVDGANRRIGKKVNGALMQGFLYGDTLKPIAELDGSNNLASRFIYAGRVNVPAYMVRGGATYRILTDHLGSPRLVVDVATGAHAQRIDYDEVGRVVPRTRTRGFSRLDSLVACMTPIPGSYGSGRVTMMLNREGGPRRTRSCCWGAPIVSVCGERPGQFG